MACVPPPIITTPFVSPSSPPFFKKASRETINTKLMIFIFSIIAFFLFLSYPHNIAFFGQLSSLLKGLGGLGSTTIATNPLGSAGPISALDLTACGPATKDGSIETVECCPPQISPNIVEFTLPPPPKSMRVRRAAHLVDDEYVAKFRRGVQLMKELPDDDPRSFKQQANVHCAYCNGAYRFMGSPDTHFDIHQSWLFLPFHRFYLYFFERILGKLIDDPDFALPYWNWDSTDGMRMPGFFTDPNSSLYNNLRDLKHQPPAVVDLNYNKIDSAMDVDHQMYMNLVVMYRQVVSGGRTPELFFGGSYHPGDPPRPYPGSMEIIPHNLVHLWVGDRGQPHVENMGAFYSAARDPIFYGHHPNIDRIWTIWKTIGGGNRKDLTDPDWLNSEFMFYDEEARLVKVKVKDCLDTEKLGYIYEQVAVPWLKARPTPRVSRNTKMKKTMKTTNDFPTKLDKVVRVMVKRRTKSSWTMNEKEAEEVLVIKGIEVDGDKFVKFDVIINDGGDEAGIRPENSEFAGSFVNVPSLHAKRSKTNLRLGISELLRDLGAVDDDNVLVTLVPRNDCAAGPVIIGGVKIVFR